jgi:putative flippase GtrA
MVARAALAILAVETVALMAAVAVEVADAAGAVTSYAASHSTDYYTSDRKSFHGRS